MNVEPDSDANEAVDPSQAAEPATPEAGAPDVEPQDANPADPSPADEQDANKSTQEVIEGLLTEEPEDEPKAEDGSSSSPEPKADSESEPDGAEASKDEGDGKGEDDEKPPPFHEHPAWKRQIEKRESAERERDTLKPQAEEYAKIDQFMKANGLSTDEAAQGYQVMAALKNDPKQALQMLKPIVDELAKQTGSVVPEDLQQKVEDGLIDADAAQRLSQAEAEKRLLEQRMKQQQQGYERQRAEATVLEMQNAASQWETDIRSKDPDYGSKQKLVEYATRAINQTKPPQSAADALANLNEAYAQVTETFKSAAPKPAPISKPPASDSSANTGSVKPSGPLTTQQVIERVLAGNAA